MDFNEFKNYYKTYKKLPFNLYYNNNKILTDKQLLERYNKFIIDKEKKEIKNKEKYILNREKNYIKNKEKSIEYNEKQYLKNKERSKEKYIEYLNDNLNDTYLDKLKDEKWEQVRQKVFERDKGRCRLLSLLSYKEIDIIKNNDVNNLRAILDTTHIIPRSMSSNLYYNIDNLVLLNRYSHSLIDSYKHPITMLPITNNEREEFWIKIIGIDLWNWLNTNK